MMTKVVRDYVSTKSTSVWRFLFEQTLFLFFQNIPSFFGVLLRGLVYRIIITASSSFGIEENVQICHAKNLTLGKNVFIGRNSYISASDGGISIGDNTCFVSNCYINVFNYNKQMGKKISIGKNVVFAHGCAIHGHSGVEIGDGTIFGPGTKIISGKHGNLSRETNFRHADILADTPVIIGRNVWIGTNVSILPGVKIGDSVVVGAGAVVTNDLEAYSIYAGSPAKLLRNLE